MMIILQSLKVIELSDKKTYHILENKITSLTLNEPKKLRLFGYLIVKEML